MRRDKINLKCIVYVSGFIIILDFEYCIVHFIHLCTERNVGDYHFYSLPILRCQLDEKMAYDTKYRELKALENQLKGKEENGSIGRPNKQQHYFCFVTNN